FQSFIAKPWNNNKILQKISELKNERVLSQIEQSDEEEEGPDEREQAITDTIMNFERRTEKERNFFFQDYNRNKTSENCKKIFTYMNRRGADLINVLLNENNITTTRIDTHTSSWNYQQREFKKNINETECNVNELNYCIANYNNNCTAIYNISSISRMQELTGLNSSQYISKRYNEFLKDTTDVSNYYYLEYVGNQTSELCKEWSDFIYDKGKNFIYMLAQEFNLIETERTNKILEWKQFKETLKNNTLTKTNNTCNMRSFNLNDTEYEFITSSITTTIIPTTITTPKLSPTPTSTNVSITESTTTQTIISMPTTTPVSTSASIPTSTNAPTTESTTTQATSYMPSTTPASTSPATTTKTATPTNIQANTSTPSTTSAITNMPITTTTFKPPTTPTPTNASITGSTITQTTISTPSTTSVSTFASTPTSTNAPTTESTTTQATISTPSTTPVSTNKLTTTTTSKPPPTPASPASTSPASTPPATTPKTTLASKTIRATTSATMQPTTSTPLTTPESTTTQATISNNASTTAPTSIPSTIQATASISAKVPSNTFTSVPRVNTSLPPSTTAPKTTPTSTNSPTITTTFTPSTALSTTFHNKSYGNISLGTPIKSSSTATKSIIIPLSVTLGSFLGILLLFIFVYRFTPIGSWLGNRRSKKKKTQRKKKQVQIDNESIFVGFSDKESEINMKNFPICNEKNS
ncbi:surface-associated interspersed protein (SURFIN), partial [Plasmodium relictum]